MENIWGALDSVGHSFVPPLQLFGNKLSIFFLDNWVEIRNIVLRMYVYNPVKECFSVKRICDSSHDRGQSQIYLTGTNKGEKSETDKTPCHDI